MLASSPQIVNGIGWAFAPDWLTVERACRLSGHDRGAMLYIIDEGGIDLSDAGLIEEQSLWEFQETLAEISHWYD